MRFTAVARAAVVGYVIGTIPSADLAARRAGNRNLRSEGSGNPGGANAMAVLGTGYGIAVMAADISKGALASAAGGRMAGGLGRHVAATAAVVGHCYPVWNGFRGGKGVATSVGQCLATFPAYLPIDITVAALSISSPRWKQRAFAATTVSSVAWVGGGLVWWRKRWPNLWGPRPSVALPVAAAASSAVIFSRFWSARR